MARACEFACLSSLTLIKGQVHHLNGYWHTAIPTKRVGLTPNDFEKLTVQSVKRNKKLKTYRMEVDDRVWCCVHCRDFPSEVYPTTLSKIQKHIDGECVLSPKCFQYHMDPHKIRRHSITEPIINQDYYENLGAAPLHSTFRCLFDESDAEDSEDYSGFHNYVESSFEKSMWSYLDHYTT